MAITTAPSATPLTHPAAVSRPQNQFAERGPRSLGTLPLVCTVITALNGLYILLVTFGNITDFGTNLEFVQHVLSMDTTNFGAEPGTNLDPDIMWRVIGSSSLQLAAYVSIIIWELATSLVLVYATILWISARKSRAFDAPLRMATFGLLSLLILFMGGFSAIGVEWFQMWRSTEWTGLDDAFQNSGLALLALILIHLRAADWDALSMDQAIDMPSR